MLTPQEYDILLGKFVMLGKALEVIQASIEDGLRTLAALRPTGLEAAVPPGTPTPREVPRVRVTKTFGGHRERELNPDEIAEQATAPARTYISTEPSDQGVAETTPPPRASGTRAMNK